MHADNKYFMIFGCPNPRVIARYFLDILINFPSRAVRLTGSITDCYHHFFSCFEKTTYRGSWGQRLYTKSLLVYRALQIIGRLDNFRDDHSLLRSWLESINSTGLVTGQRTGVYCTSVYCIVYNAIRDTCSSFGDWINGFQPSRCTAQKELDSEQCKLGCKIKNLNRSWERNSQAYRIRTHRKSVW